MFALTFTWQSVPGIAGSAQSRILTVIVNFLRVPGPNTAAWTLTGPRRTSNWLTCKLVPGVVKASQSVSASKQLPVAPVAKPDSKVGVKSTSSTAPSRVTCAFADGDGNGKEVLVAKEETSATNCEKKVREERPDADGVTWHSRGSHECYAIFNWKNAGTAGMTRFTSNYRTCRRTTQDKRSFDEMVGQVTKTAAAGCDDGLPGDGGGTEVLVAETVQSFTNCTSRPSRREQ